MYNNRELEGFLACFSDDVKVLDLNTNNYIATSKQEMKPRYEKRF
jgi:hypothetical protein